MPKLGVLYLFVFLRTVPLLAQDYTNNELSDTLSKSRFRKTVIVGGLVYAGGMTALYRTWYKQYNTGKFHFFNDAAEWEGMDKIGHSFTTYTLSRFGYEALSYSGVDNTKSTLFGAGYAMLFQTTIELFDGFSAGWGFSWTDMASNTIGAGLFAVQQVTWQEQRINLKFSYSSSSYAQYRSNLLGRTWNERILKDYNGQTYWLSGNISSFLSKETRFPKWINVAIGYGADGMIGGHKNPDHIDGLPVPNFDRLQQYYVSADIDFTRIKTRSKAIRKLFKALSWIKMPLPAIEFNSKGNITFHPLYF